MLRRIINRLPYASRQRLWGLFLSALSGLGSAFTFDNADFSFLIWFSLTPLFYVLRRASFKQGVLYAFSFAVVFYGTVLFWVAHVSCLGLLALILCLSLYPVLFFIAARCFFNRPFEAVALAALWVIIEFIKEHVWCGFGWANLGYSQYLNRYVIQIADLGGAGVVSFFIVIVNAVLVNIFLARRYFRRGMIWIAFIFLSSFAYSSYRLHGLESKSGINICVVQPNVREEEKYEASSAPLIEARLFSLARASGAGGLVVFPEAAWPQLVDTQDPALLSAFVSRLGKDVLIGAVGRRGSEFSNRAYFFDTGGNLINDYAKVKLVPFGEYVPARRFFGFVPVINDIGDMTPGKDMVVFPYRDKKFGVLICFEDIFPDFVRCAARNVDFLTNITNDAWFYGMPQAGQHLAIMVLRAIENRISIVRAANTGISGAVTYRGDLILLSRRDGQVFFEGKLDLELPLNSERSVYNIIGAVLPLFYLTILGVVLYLNGKK